MNKQDKLLETLNVVDNIATKLLYLILMLFLDLIAVTVGISMIDSSIILTIFYFGVGLYLTIYFLGKILGFDDDNNDNPPPTAFTGDDALGCISGEVISHNITRGL